MEAFDRHIGIDYSGAETATSSLRGLRVFRTRGGAEPEEVPLPPSPQKYWTRKELAYALVRWLFEDDPTLVAIDHGFSFPVRYFEKHGIPPATGTCSSTISTVTGLPTRTTCTWTSFATRAAATALRARAAAGGDDSPRYGRAVPSRSFTSMCRGRWPTPLTRGFRGCGSSAASFGAQVHFWPFDG